MGISVREQSCGDMRLQSSMRGGPGGLEPGPPGQPVLPRIHEQKQVGGFPGPWEAGMLQGQPRQGKTQSPATATEGCVPSGHWPSRQRCGLSHGVAFDFTAT